MPPSYSLDSIRNEALRLQLKRQLSSKWASCDPGLSGTGVAIWNGYKLKAHVTLSSNLDLWYKAAESIAYKVLAESRESVMFFYELPQFMEAARMANRRGDITKLTMLAGMIHGRMSGLTGCMDVVPVPIPEWKGNMKKELMNARVIKRLETHPEFLSGIAVPKTATTHELDAIGVGLYALGAL